MKVMYRLSDKGQPKPKLPQATKEYCLRNAMASFPNSEIFVFADNCEAQTIAMIESLGLKCIPITLGNSGSLRHAISYAVNQYDNNEGVYFLEDDYLHLQGSEKLMLEGLEISDYVTLYDHPDKYADFDGKINPQVTDQGEQTILMKSDSSHWKVTNSTTMTFAVKVGTLKEDLSVWFKHTKRKVPADKRIFSHLQSTGKLKYRLFGKKRRLIVSIPGSSTHCETAFLTPLTDWSKV
ncbi:MAG: hypothetical protein RIC35_17675 [Marinoscillum sp.]